MGPKHVKKVMRLLNRSNSRLVVASVVLVGLASGLQAASLVCAAVVLRCNLHPRPSYAAQRLRLLLLKPSAALGTSAAACGARLTRKRFRAVGPFICNFSTPCHLRVAKNAS